MKVIAVNGSPRKNYNTAQLLKSALEGAQSAGAETELVNLIDLSYKGCISCFACHRKGNPRAGHCCVRDGLTPLLEEIEKCGALIIGSPIYIGDVTSLTRAFLERLIFQYVSYDNHDRYATLFGGHVNAACIFDMNCPEDFAKTAHAYVFDNIAADLTKLGGTVSQLLVNETYQFDDYSKYNCAMFDEPERRRIRDEVFPQKLAEAYEIGRSLALAKNAQP